MIKYLLSFMLATIITNNCFILYKPNNIIITESKLDEIKIPFSFNFRAESLQEWAIDRDSLDTGFSTNYYFQQVGLKGSLVKLSKRKAMLRSLSRSEIIHLEISQIKTVPKDVTVMEGLNAFFSSFTLFLIPTKLTGEIAFRFEVHKEKKHIKTYTYKQSYIMYMSSFPVYFFNESSEIEKEIFDPIISSLLLDMQKDMLL